MGKHTHILSLLRFPLGKIVRNTAGTAYRHECTDAAGAMAFEMVFAIFPCLLVLTALMVITGTPPEAFNQLIVELGIIIPPPLLAIVEARIAQSATSVVISCKRPRLKSQTIDGKQQKGSCVSYDDCNG